MHINVQSTYLLQILGGTTPSALSSTPILVNQAKGRATATKKIHVPSLEKDW